MCHSRPRGKMISLCGCKRGVEETREKGGDIVMWVGLGREVFEGSTCAGESSPCLSRPSILVRLRFFSLQGRSGACSVKALSSLKPGNKKHGWLAGPLFSPTPASAARGLEMVLVILPGGSNRVIDSCFYGNVVLLPISVPYLVFRESHCLTVTNEIEFGGWEKEELMRRLGEHNVRNNWFR